MNPAAWLGWGRYYAARLAWPGVLGLGLVLVAATIQLAGVTRIQDQNEELRLATERLRERAAMQAEALPVVDVRRLAALPSGDELVPLVASVHALAHGRQVSLDQGEYSWQADAGGRSGRYRMSFPARGRYPQLRGWAADVLAEWPALALEEFDFRRDTIGNENVEAQVRFSVRVGEGRP
ncbi:MAG: hypothetical protein HZA64_12330 [Rhodocyclales bacterium]|nr:hypothetical protein [Rhodocyclales bacterium]